jgi:DNA-binding winged helix-turn-helix (wHTH) protein/Tol biopolymer transport system component
MRATLFRFGIFEFDPTQHELRRRGLRLPLSLSQTRLLQFFLGHAGQLVTRDQIASCLWGDERNVDVSNGINTAVNRLRAVFRDDVAAPKFIETVVGVGYRFIAAVEVADSAVSPLSASNRDIPGDVESGIKGAGSPANSAPLVDPAVATLLAEATVYEPRTRTGAISWWLAGLALVLLVAASFAARSAFLRHREDVSAKAQPLFPDPFSELTFNDGDDAITTSDMAPDGRSVAYSDHSGVSVQLLADGSQRRIPTPGDFQVDRISWYATGAELLVSGVGRSARRAQVWVLSLSGAPPRELFASEGDDPAQATLARTTGQMAFTLKQGTERWVAGPDAQTPRRILTAGVGEKFLFLLWSPGGKRLLFERYSAGWLARTGSPVAGSGNPVEDLKSLDHWSCEFVEPSSGKILAVQDNVRFDSAYMAGDGKLFYPVNDSYAELQRARLMEVDTDPATGRFLTAPRIAFNFNAGLASSVSASPDGKVVTAVLQRRTSDIYTAEVRLPGPTLSAIDRLTSHSLDDLPHAFTPDGSAVLFESRRLGRDAIFEQKVAGTSPDHFSGGDAGAFTQGSGHAGVHARWQVDSVHGILRPPQSCRCHLSRLRLGGRSDPGVYLGGSRRVSLLARQPGYLRVARDGRQE